MSIAQISGTTSEFKELTIDELKTAKRTLVAQAKNFCGKVGEEIAEDYWRQLMSYYHPRVERHAKRRAFRIEQKTEEGA